MARPLKSLSTDVDNGSTNVDRQAGFTIRLSERLRTIADQEGVGYSDLLSISGASSSAFANYWTGKRPWPLETLVTVANRLNASVDRLVGHESTNVVAADDADWVEVPTFDLANMTDGDKGEAVRVTPMRRDWLNGTIGATSALWLVEVPCDYPPLDLVEGDKVLCRDISVPELHDRHLCIWREADTERLFIGRYSVVRPESVYIDNAGEYWVGKINVSLADPPPTIFPIGRIVGRPITRIR